jgi:hypothetical protein
VQVCARRIIKAIHQRKNQITIAGTKEHILIWFKKNIPWLFYRLVDKVKPV